MGPLTYANQTSINHTKYVHFNSQAPYPNAKSMPTPEFPLMLFVHAATSPFTFWKGFLQNVKTWLQELSLIQPQENISEIRH